MRQAAANNGVHTPLAVRENSQELVTVMEDSHICSQMSVLGVLVLDEPHSCSTIQVADHPWALQRKVKGTTCAFAHVYVPDMYSDYLDPIHLVWQ